MMRFLLPLTLLLLSAAVLPSAAGGGASSCAVSTDLSVLSVIECWIGIPKSSGCQPKITCPIYTVSVEVDATDDLQGQLSAYVTGTLAGAYACTTADESAQGTVVTGHCSGSLTYEADPYYSFDVACGGQLEVIDQLHTQASADITCVRSS